MADWPIGRGQLGEDVELHLIGVLELVDEQMTMPGTHRVANIAPTTKQPAGQHQQIIERQLAAADAVARRLDDDRGQRRHQLTERRLAAGEAHCPP